MRGTGEHEQRRMRKEDREGCGDVAFPSSATAASAARGPFRAASVRPALIIDDIDQT
jgi:hypothetical protein